MNVFLIFHIGNIFKIGSIKSIQKMYMRNKIFKVFRGQSYPQTTDLSSNF